MFLRVDAPQLIELPPVDRNFLGFQFGVGFVVAANSAVINLNNPSLPTCAFIFVACIPGWLHFNMCQIATQTSGAIHMFVTLILK